MKKNLRKLWVGSIGVSMAAVVSLTGCGGGQKQTSGSGSSDGGSGQPVTLNALFGKINALPKEQEKLMNDLVADFEKKNPGIKVKWTTYDTAEQENSILQTSLATKQGPDVFEFGSTIVPTADATNGFRALTKEDWDSLGGQSKFFPAQLKMSGKSPDQYIAVPEIVQPFAMVYNKKMFKEAGISAPPKTWDEFLDDAKKITKPDKDQWGSVICPLDGFVPWKIGWELGMQAGADFTNKDYTKTTIDSKQSIDALTFWFDWVTKYKIASPNSLTYKGVDATKAFANGHVGMYILVSNTLVPSLQNSAVKDDWAFAPMPTIPLGMTATPSGGVPVQTFVSGQYLSITKYSAHPKEALKWIQYLTSVDAQRKFFDVYGYLPANLDAFKGYDPLNTDTVKAFIEAENNAYPTPFTGAFGNIEVVYGGVSSKIANAIATKSYKVGDIEAALHAANQQAQAALKQ